MTVSNHQLRIVPGLRAVQDRHGYLKREELEELARSTDLPLHRLNEVASFFPHFRSAAPPPVVVHVCRDMACHMAGSDQIVKALGAQESVGVRAEGVSCLGRCDRAPAAMVTLHRPGNDGKVIEQERLYCGQSAANLPRIVAACEKAMRDGGTLPKCDHDASHDLPGPRWQIDPYSLDPTSAGSEGVTPIGPEPYAAARKVAAARLVAIDEGAAALAQVKGWNSREIQAFIMATGRRQPGEASVAGAALEFLTASGAAKEMPSAGWSDRFLAELDDAHADLRGMGGAGIPATQKWRDVRDAVRNARRRQEDDRAFIVVNGDESEPGTFKDRELLLRTPHLVVEAVIIAGLLTEATEGIIYIRHEYHEQIESCRKEIARAAELGLCGSQTASVLGRPFSVSVFVSPGGYICGEQSALIEAMSDRRAEPRNMPPKLETNGLDDQPTLVSNVETFAWVPYILLNGGSAYAALGVNEWRGRRFFSVSGDVGRPGVYEVPMGLTLRELIFGEAYCGGMKNGVAFKAVAPSGPSGGFLPARLHAQGGLPGNHLSNRSWQALARRRQFDPAADSLDVLDLELELNLFRALSPTQALGAGIVVYGQTRDMIDQAVNALQFYRSESCGKCVPCRIGSQKMATLATYLRDGKVSRAEWVEQLQPLVNELGKVMELSSICGLGRSVPVPLRTAAEFFSDDLDKHLVDSPAAALPAAPAPVSAIISVSSDASVPESAPVAVGGPGLGVKP